MPSIEILVEASSHDKSFSGSVYPFAVCSSKPPISHREPSVWQQEFLKINGTLYHLGEARFKAQKAGWFYAYDLLKLQAMSKFRFKPNMKVAFYRLLHELLRQSDNQTIHFTSDWQLCRCQPRRLKKIYSLSEFIKRHDESGIPFNVWITIAGY